MPQDAKSQKNGGKLPQIRSVALIAVGSNMGFQEKSIESTVESALINFPRGVCVIRKKSAFYRTAAFPKGSGPDFVNAALAVETSLSPREMLDLLHEIESTFGRDRKERWGPRTLDLDLVAYDDLVLPDRQVHTHWVKLSLEEQMKVAPDQLILPHPRLAERAFVLVPLCDVAPDWVHPITGTSVKQMRDALTQEQLSEVTLL